VALTFRNTDGSSWTKIVNAIWRVMADNQEVLEGAANQRQMIGVEPTINGMFLAADITLAQLRSVMYAQPIDSTGQPGTQYTLTNVQPIGMQPGGDRIFTIWTRQT